MEGIQQAGFIQVTVEGNEHQPAFLKASDVRSIKPEGAGARIVGSVRYEITIVTETTEKVMAQVLAALPATTLVPDIPRLEPT